VRIILIGDALGIQQLLWHLQNQLVVDIVGASIRTYYLAELQRTADKVAVPFLIQLKLKSEKI
jgi:hypothetical protein